MGVHEADSLDGVDGRASRRWNDVGFENKIFRDEDVGNSELVHFKAKIDRDLQLEDYFGSCTPK